MLYAHGAIMGFGGGVLHLWIFGVGGDDRATELERRRPGSTTVVARPRAGRRCARPGGRAARAGPDRRGHLAARAPVGRAHLGCGPAAGCSRRARDPAEAAALARELGVTVGDRRRPRPGGGVAACRSRRRWPPRREVEASERVSRRRADDAGPARCASGAPSCSSARATCGDEDDAHPAYARILDDLAPDEARILMLLAAVGPAAERRRPHRRPGRHGQQPADRAGADDDRRAGRAAATSTGCRPTSTTCTGSGWSGSRGSRCATRWSTRCSRRSPTCSRRCTRRGSPRWCGAAST